MAGPDPPDFDSLLREYARYRTGYSPELIARALAAAPVASPRVLDLASGTGLAARDLASRAGRLVGVDIARAMLAANPHAERALARAETLPFRDASFDLVTCAQAFHWMGALPTYREMHRVLAPGGAAAVWWKYEEPGSDVWDVTEASFRRVTGSAPPHTSIARGERLPGIASSPFERAEEARLPFETTYTVDAYVGYHASRENFRRAAGPLREAALEDLRRALAARFPEGVVTVRYQQRLALLRKAAR